MSTPPPLPAGDDPFELLGVGPDADERTVRRAYTRLIRIYRAEHHPEEFKRIRAAYEIVRAQFAPQEDTDVDGGWEPPFDLGALGLDGPSSSPSPAPDAHPTSDEWRVPGVWPAAGDGAFANARDTLETAAGARPSDATVYAHGFLLEELGGDDEAAAAWLDRGVEQSKDMAVWIFRSLDSDTAGRIAARGAFGWGALGSQTDRPARASLFRSRCRELLVRGQLEALVEEVSQRSFRRIALDDGGLRAAAIEIASVLVWEDLERGRELFEMFASDVGRDDDEGVEDRFFQTLSLAEDWLAWEGRHCAPAVFCRFVQLGFAWEHTARLGRALRTGLAAYPEDYGVLFGRLHREAAGLHAHVLACLGGDPFEEEQDDEDIPEADPATRAALNRSAVAIERDLERAGANRLSSLALIVHVALMVGGFFLLGWWGLLTLVALFATYSMMASRLDGRLYRNCVRPELVRLIARHSIHPARVVALVKERSGVTNELGRFMDEVDEDQSLRTIYLVTRFGRD